MNSEKSYAKTLKIVAENLQFLRRSRGLSQTDMGELGFDVRHIQRIESGDHSTSLYTLQRLADAYKVNIQEIFKKRSKKIVKAK